MKQKTKRFFASALIACLLGAATLPAAAASAVQEISCSDSQEEAAPINEAFLSQAQDMIAAYWDDSCVSEIRFTAGEAGAQVDGTTIGKQIGCRKMDNTFFLSAQTFADAAGGEVSFHAETNAIQLSDGTASMEIQNSAGSSSSDSSNDLFLPAEQIAEELGYRIAHQDDSSITFVKSFQTMRLIVQSPKTVLQGNEYGAIETIDDGDGTYVMQFDSIENTKAAYEILLDTKGVESVEEDLIVALEEVPMEQPDFAAEQYLSWGSQRIGADEWLNDMTEEQKNRPVVVAVLDTMAYSDHSALSGRLLEGTSMMGSENQEDIYGHGTHVSGIVADATKGTQVKILPVQVLSGTTGKGSALGAALGIQWAVSHGADVINISLSGEYSYANGSHYLDKVIRKRWPTRSWWWPLPEMIPPIPDSTVLPMCRIFSASAL